MHRVEEQRWLAKPAPLGSLDLRLEGRFRRTMRGLTSPAKLFDDVKDLSSARIRQALAGIAQAARGVETQWQGSNAKLRGWPGRGERSGELTTYLLAQTRMEGDHQSQRLRNT